MECYATIQGKVQSINGGLGNYIKPLVSLYLCDMHKSRLLCVGKLLNIYWMQIGPVSCRICV